MQFSRKKMEDHMRENDTTDEYKFEHVHVFKYLGAVLLSEDSVREEIKQRMTF